MIEKAVYMCYSSCELLNDTEFLLSDGDEEKKEV